MKARSTLLSVLVGLVALIAFAGVRGDLAMAASGNKLVGTWRISLLSPDGSEFVYNMTFHRGNTVTSTPPSDFAEFSSAAGVWEKISGDDDDDNTGRGSYSITAEFFQDVTGDGTADFRIRGRNTIRVDGDTLSGTAAVDVLTPDGSTLVATFPGWTQAGTRLAVIPE